MGTKVQFLGHVIDNKGIHVDPAKIESVKDCLSRPQRRLLVVLGLAGSMDDSLEGFSKIAKPMAKAHSKKVKFEWGDKQEARSVIEAEVVFYSIFLIRRIENETTPMSVLELLSDYDCDISFITPGRANVVQNKFLNAQTEARKPETSRLRLLEELATLLWRFGDCGHARVPQNRQYSIIQKMNARLFVWAEDGEVQSRSRDSSSNNKGGDVATSTELPEELRQSYHNTFHASVFEDPIEIKDREVKRSRDPFSQGSMEIQRRSEFTWDVER
ncbi:hypothetical protein Tco_1227999 [Tanacetum coccineum]